jgi:hypothetical protein
MPSRVRAEQLAVQHVRQPRQRVPLARPMDAERPHDAVSGEPAAHVGVQVDEVRIVVEDEVERGRWQVQREGRQEKSSSNDGSRDLAEKRYGLRGMRTARIKLSAYAFGGVAAQSIAWFSQRAVAPFASVYPAEGSRKTSSIWERENGHEGSGVTAVVRIGLAEIGASMGPGVTLTANAGAGIIAADGGAPWAGVTDVELPFP